MTGDGADGIKGVLQTARKRNLSMIFAGKKPGERFADAIDTGVCCPACGDDGYRDYMVDEFTESGVSVRLAVCENRNCRVREFYVPVAEPHNVSTDAQPRNSGESL